MNILVTGGAGFLGSNLVNKLIADGESVIVVDNLFTGSEKNFKHLIGNPNFKFIRHDIVNPLKIDEPIKQIYNLACPASPPFYRYNPVKTTKACTIGMINILELAKKHNARILQASTSEIYGNPKEHPQREDYCGNVNTLGPRACYDEGKRVAETLMMDYYREFGVDTRIIRIFNTYGPNMKANDGRVISNFIIQALKGEPITIYGKGEQTRSFCYVDDLVDGMCRLMKSNYVNPVNIGNPDEKTILETAQEIIKLTNSKSEIVYKPLPDDDPARRKPDIDLANLVLNWRPSICFTDGLQKTIEYFKKELNI